MTPVTSRRFVRSSSGATGSTRSPTIHGTSWRSKRSSPITAARCGRKAAASRAPGCPGDYILALRVKAGRQKEARRRGRKSLLAHLPRKEAFDATHERTLDGSKVVVLNVSESTHLACPSPV